MSTLDEKIRIWSQAPSITEMDRINSTERAIRDAISKSSDPRVVEAKIFAKGSVKSRTNIRNGSDIDIVVMPKNVFLVDYPNDLTDKDFQNSEAGYTYGEFRSAVLKALREKFGFTDIEDGNKALKIRGTFSGSRIDADVIPAFEHRRYTTPGDSNTYHEGMEFIAKNGKHTINWPHHNYDNTIWKQDETGKRYRKVIRVLKNLRREMQDQGISAANDIASFLIESLAWNAPNNLYNGWTLTDDVISVLDHTIGHTSSQESCDEWGEVNELKYLFKGGQKWTRAQANGYLVAAREYLEGI